jgi:hypothetical protein
VLIGVITFIIVLVAAVILMAVFGAVGTFELLLAIVVALAAAFIAQRRDGRRRSTVA